MVAPQVSGAGSTAYCSGGEITEFAPDWTTRVDFLGDTLTPAAIDPDNWFVRSLVEGDRWQPTSATVFATYVELHGHANVIANAQPAAVKYVGSDLLDSHALPVPAFDWTPINDFAP